MKILVQDLGKYVAIAEEFPNEASAKIKSGGLLHNRRVSRVITPGTLIDENFMDPYSSNYILAIYFENAIIRGILEAPDSSTAIAGLADATIGLAWLDLSTGHFYTQSASLSMLSSVISRVAPREIVIDERLREIFGDSDFSLMIEEGHNFTYCSVGETRTIMDWNPMLQKPVSTTEASRFTQHEVKVGGFLLHYVETRLQGLDLKLQPPIRYKATESMVIDKNSMRALEIRRTIRDSHYQGTLSHAMRRTVTRSGTRLLDDWLSKTRQPIPDYHVPLS